MLLMPLHKTDEEMLPSDLRTARTAPVTGDAPTTQANGQLSSYVVIADGDRNPDDFVRPVRQSYLHIGEYQAQSDEAGNRIFKECGVVTTMSRSIAETYARKPDFYGSTFCCGCGGHYPVGKHGMFVWVAPDGHRELRDVGEGSKPWKVGT